MSRYIFLINLDTVITKEEIFPTILTYFNLSYPDFHPENLSPQGELPFQKNFLHKVDILKNLPVTAVNTLLENITISLPLTSFLQSHYERCYIVTEYFNIWISGLINRLGMKQHTFCSTASAKNNLLHSIDYMIDKKAAAYRLGLPYVAVGRGNDDAELIENAEAGIGYGGVKEITPSVLSVASHAIYDERTLVYFLERLL